MLPCSPVPLLASRAAPISLLPVLCSHYPTCPPQDLSSSVVPLSPKFEPVPSFCCLCLIVYVCMEISPVSMASDRYVCLFGLVCLWVVGVFCFVLFCSVYLFVFVFVFRFFFFWYVVTSFGLEASMVRGRRQSVRTVGSREARLPWVSHGIRVGVGERRQTFLVFLGWRVRTKQQSPPRARCLPLQGFLESSQCIKSPLSCDRQHHPRMNTLDL